MRRQADKAEKERNDGVCSVKDAIQQHVPDWEKLKRVSDRVCIACLERVMRRGEYGVYGLQR
eukprot:7508916-Heterocapsa_arctica.AAC.1